MKPEEIYQAIIRKREETGEDPLEYNESALPNKLIFIGFVMGSGFMSVEHTEIMLKLITSGDIEEFYQLVDYMDIYVDKGIDAIYKELSKFIGSLESYQLRFKREFE